MNFEQYRALQQKTIIDELKVSFVVQGEGMPLLLIQGIPVWGYLWKGCIPLLAKHFQLIIPDLVGDGYSDQRDCFDRSIKVQSRILSNLLQQLEVQDLSVVGHDIDGAVPQRFVVDHANQVPKSVLRDSVLYESWPAEPIVCLGNPKQHFKTKGVQLARKFIERLPDGFHHREKASPEVLAGWMAPYLTDEGKLSLIRNATALNTNHSMELLEDLQKLKQPLLLLREAKEQFHHLSSAERFVDEFPGSQLHVVPDSDHFLPLEKPEEVARILIYFLG